MCLLEDEADKELFESYSAQCLWIIAGAVSSLGGGEFNLPQYVELINPELKDKKSAQEIKDHVIKRLLEG